MKYKQVQNILFLREGIKPRALLTAFALSPGVLLTLSHKYVGQKVLPPFIFKFTFLTACYLHTQQTHFHIRKICSSTAAQLSLPDILPVISVTEATSSVMKVCCKILMLTHDKTQGNINNTGRNKRRIQSGTNPASSLEIIIIPTGQGTDTTNWVATIYFGIFRT